MTTRAALPRRTFTTQEAADQLGVSRWTVYNMVRDGTLDAIRTGPTRRHAILITADSLERLLEGRAAS